MSHSHVRRNIRRRKGVFFCDICVFMYVLAHGHIDLSAEQTETTFYVLDLHMPAFLIAYLSSFFTDTNSFFLTMACLPFNTYLLSSYHMQCSERNKMIHETNPCSRAISDHGVNNDKER